VSLGQERQEIVVWIGAGKSGQHRRQSIGVIAGASGQHHTHAVGLELVGLVEAARVQLFGRTGQRLDKIGMPGIGRGRQAFAEEIGISRFAQGFQVMLLVYMRHFVAEHAGQFGFVAQLFHHALGDDDIAARRGKRIRHRVWVAMPFKGEKVEPKSWYLAGLVEGFMSWGDRVKYGSIIDQYRLYLAPGYQFSKNGNIQVGPFYQYLLKSTGDKYENNIGAYLQLNYNFDFSKPAAN